MVLLDDDVAAAFRDSASVNEALRSLLDLAETTKRLTRRPDRSSEETVRRSAGLDCPRGRCAAAMLHNSRN